MSTDVFKQWAEKQYGSQEQIEREYANVENEMIREAIRTVLANRGWPLKDIIYSRVEEVLTPTVVAELVAKIKGE